MYRQPGHSFRNLTPPPYPSTNDSEILQLWTPEIFGANTKDEGSKKHHKFVRCGIGIGGRWRYK